MTVLGVNTAEYTKLVCYHSPDSGKRIVEYRLPTILVRVIENKEVQVVARMF